MRAFGLGEGEQTYKDTLSAAIAYLAIPQAWKVTAGASSVAYSGTWVDMAHNGRMARDNGATATFSFEGATLYIVSERVSRQSGQFTVAIDGALYGTYNCYGNLPTPLGRTYAPFLIRIAGLTAGSHTAVITKSAGDGVYFNWAAVPGAVGGPKGLGGQYTTHESGRICARVPDLFARQRRRGAAVQRHHPCDGHGFA